MGELNNKQTYHKDREDNKQHTMISNIHSAYFCTTQRNKIGPQRKRMDSILEGVVQGDLVQDLMFMLIFKTKKKVKSSHNKHNGWGKCLKKGMSLICLKNSKKNVKNIVARMQ